MLSQTENKWPQTSTFARLSMLEQKRPIIFQKLKFTLTPIATTTSPESQTYPVTTGAIFHKLSPKLQHSRYPFSPDQQSAETTEADWQSRNDGEESRKEGEAAGRE